MWRPPLRWLRRAAVPVSLLCVPLAIHLIAANGRFREIAPLLAAAESAFVTWVAVGSLTGRSRPVAATVAAAAGTLAVWLLAQDGAAVASGVPHAIIYASLLVVFAGSLRPGREAIITTFATRVRGPLAPKVTAYTRRVTWFWCGIFAAQILVSLLLLIAASRPAWSVFVNVLHLPIVVALFLAEYAYRQWRHAHQPRDRLSDLLRFQS
jgi:uncharacterized membrane protein